MLRRHAGSDALSVPFGSFCGDRWMKIRQHFIRPITLLRGSMLDVLLSKRTIALRVCCRKPGVLTGCRAVIAESSRRRRLAPRALRAAPVLPQLLREWATGCLPQTPVEKLA